MKIKKYIDIVVCSDFWGKINPGAPLIKTTAHLIETLHRNTEKIGEFAIAFPDISLFNKEIPDFNSETGVSEIKATFMGNRVRVFASNIDTIKSIVESDLVLSQMIRVGEEKKVPDNFDGLWVQYRYFRIPSAKRSNRERRIDRAKSLLHFKIYSQTGSRVFPLYIDPVVCDGNRVDLTKEVKPNSYGLSVRTREFALPDIK